MAATTASSSSSPLNSLFDYGSQLANLLHEAKFQKGCIRRTILSRDRTTDHSISFPKNYHERVKVLVMAFFNDLKGAISVGSLSGDSMAKVMNFIEDLLHKFVQVDKAHAETYEKLAKHVEDFQSSNVVERSLSSLLNLEEEEDKYFDDDDDKDNDDFLVKYKNLSYDEKRCLFYFTLFPDGTEIKKRELICLWIGMTSLLWQSDGGESEAEKVLSTLVANGFIYQVTRNNRLSKRYRMRGDGGAAGVRAKVMERAAAEPSSLRYFQTSNRNSSFIIHYVDAEFNTSSSVEALFNIGTHTLNASTLEPLINSRDAVVIHLGSNFHDYNNKENTDFIVVQDMDSLDRALEQQKQVRFLSLGGISGIIQLPDSVCELNNLVVLDLRDCNNLESLPQKIGSLTQLICLDLSECYLLGHIPSEISLLTKLRVLKGFVINPDHDQQVIVDSCKFSDLSEMKQLNKLTIRTRRMNFPTPQDLLTLCTMEELHTLRIAWVGQPKDAPQTICNKLSGFPFKVHKLELQSVPERTASELLQIISCNGQENNSVVKLYIRGALGKQLDLIRYSFPRIKQIRLRYLPQLCTHWDRFLRSFPSLARLQIYQCPNLTSFKCNNNGLWESIVDEKLW